MDDFKQFVRRMYSVDGYFERFYEIYQNCRTGAEAFELLEREYYELFGANRYSDYNAFMVMRRRYILRLQIKARKK